VELLGCWCRLLLLLLLLPLPLLPQPILRKWIT
jgi:hypothetical protein